MLYIYIIYHHLIASPLPIIFSQPSSVYVPKPPTPQCQLNLALVWNGSKGDCHLSNGNVNQPLADMNHEILIGEKVPGS